MESLIALLYYLIMSSDLVFLHGEHFSRCEARVDKHFVGYCSLQFMSAGGVELKYDQETFELAGRWFWPAFPGPRIRFHTAPGQKYWEHRYVAFQGPLVNRWMADGLFPKHPQPAPRGVKWAQTFDRLLFETHRGGRWGTLRGINQLEHILLILAEHRHEAAPNEPWLATLLKKLHDAGQFTADYETLAQEAGMSLSTLRRQFRRLTGVSLHAYSMQCRIARARTLLGESDFTIKQIALRLGYSDVYFFSKQFKQAVGIPPAMYRRSRQF